MISSLTTEANDKRAKRNVAVLILAQATLGAQMPVHFVLGGLSGQHLSPDKCLSTLPISLIVFGSMVASPLLANFMQSHGRTAGFFVGALGGVLGASLAALALILGSFPLFLAGAFVTGIYMAANGMYRFAAVDTASDDFRPKAISWTLAGGLMAAIIGPQMVNVTSDALNPVPFAGAYVAVAILNLVFMWIFLALDIPKPPKAQKGAVIQGRTRWQMLKTPRILVAMICAMVSYSLMNLVMTSTPLAVVGCGFALTDASNIVSAHVLAMFVPSFFTGHLIARFGVERIIAAGLVILTASGIVAILGVTLFNFYVALILLGLGWNFGFVGGTTMLTQSHTPEERGRIQGMNDFAVFGLVTIASLSSGLLMNCSGSSAVQGWSAVNYAMIPFLALAGGALIWLWLSQKATPETA